jgi:DNA mismatch repair protein MutS2
MLSAMEPRTISMLEFPKILKRLSEGAVSSPGKKTCLETVFIADPGELDQESALLREIIFCHREYRPALNFFPDITPYLNDLPRPEAVLDLESLWDFSSLLSEAERSLAFFREIDPDRFPMLSSIASRVPWPEKLSAALSRCIGSSGEIRDESSPGLYSTREEIRSIRQQCARKVNESQTISNISHYLQDEYLTISSDRYVLALKANFKGRVQGIIHDYSQTGETCYFEPFFLTELNNKLQTLKRQEREELLAVFRYLTGLCREAADEVQELFKWLVRMDFLLAKAGFAARLEAGPLNISDAGQLRLINVRHPLLVLGGFAATPVDIELMPGQQVLVISGGNAGGKTVCLKTLGLAALMALCALPVPADEGSSIPMWNKVFVSMVSEQSVEESLSTFTSQIHHFSRFWPLLDERSLVILDEFGVGTDPSQGAALAQAVVDRLLEKKVWVATATHFPALKAYALSRDEVRAASVLFDQDTGKPLYRMAYDQVGSSLALGVAREQGLPGEIIARAEKYLLMDGQYQDTVFKKLNSLAVQREKELERIRNKEALLEEQFEKKKRELVREKHLLLDEIRTSAREILSQWQNRKISRKKALKDLADLKQKAGELQEGHSGKPMAFSWDDVSPGDRYFYRPWNRQGIVQEKDEKKKQVKVDLGGISLWVQVSDLEHSPDFASSGRERHALVKSPGSVPLRLDLRGRYAGEALSELDQYLDQAILAGRKNIEVIHGKGTGALRAAVHEHLKNSPVVASFKCASEESGGDGVTEVELR